MARWHVSANVLSPRIGSARPDALREEYKRPVMGQPVLAAKPLTSRETVSHYAASNGQTIRTSPQKSIRAFHFGGTVSHIMRPVRQVPRRSGVGSLCFVCGLLPACVGASR